MESTLPDSSTVRAAAARARRQKMLLRGADRLKNITQGSGTDVGGNLLPHDNAGADTQAYQSQKPGAKLPAPTGPAASSRTVPESSLSSTSSSDPKRSASATAAPRRTERVIPAVSAMQKEQQIRGCSAEGVLLPSSEWTTVQQTGLPVPGRKADHGASRASALQGSVKPRLLVAVLAGLLWGLFGSDDSLQGSSLLQLLIQALPMLPILICAQSAILAAAQISLSRAATAVVAQEAGDFVSTSSAGMPATLRVMMSLAPPAVRSALSRGIAILHWARAVGQGVAVAVIVGAALESNKEHIFQMGARVSLR